MKKADEVKENIIAAATVLIQKSSGNITEITTRAIAEKADVGIGLINYHFQSKDNLITLCVQRIISRVIAEFTPEKQNETNRKERLTGTAIQVFHFLFENPAISRISILGDLQNYRKNSNSAYTQNGFARILNRDADDRIIAFVLTAAMQAAFLSGAAGKELTGFDLSKQEDRACFITKLVSVLLRDE